MSSRSLLHLLTAGVLLLLALVGWQLYQGRQSAIDRAAGDASNLVLALDGQLSAVLRRMDSNLHSIAERLPSAALHAGAISRHDAAVQRLLQPYLSQFPAVTGYYVWSARSGELLYSTSPVPPGSRRPSIAARAGFAYLQAEPTARIAFSESIRSSVTGRQTVAVYVPVRDSQQRLLAVVTATLNLERLALSFEALRLPPRSVVFVRRSDDHRLVIRYPHLDSELNKPVRNAISRRIDAGESQGQERFQAVTDGELRIYGFRKLEGYPFYVVVGLSEHSVLQGWRQAAAVVLALLFVLGLVLLAALVRMARLQLQRQAAEQQVQQTYDLLHDAINSIPVGITIYGPDDRLVMNNEALLRIFDGIRDVLQPGRTFEEVTRTALQRGLYAQAGGQPEAWLAWRVQIHQQADGQPHELQLADGRWIEFSEHRTPHGYTVSSRIDITERKRLEQELRALASTDELTGLANRRQFMQRLEEELERVRRQTTRAACVLMLDLDHFKQVNDRHGHAAGDRLLQHFGQLLRQELRSVDTAARMGGEEFAVILPGTDMRTAQAIAQRIGERLAAQPLNVGAQQLRVTVSVGVAAIDGADLSADAVLARADAALYRAKAQGRNRVELALA
jgi:diguanylate cyclase (GGDEF)-like protein